MHEAICPLPVVVGLLRDLTRSREQLIAENALLRQQVIMAFRKGKLPVFKLCIPQHLGIHPENTQALVTIQVRPISAQLQGCSKFRFNCKHLFA